MDDKLHNLKKRINNFKEKNNPFLSQKNMESKEEEKYSNAISICIQLTASIIVGLIIGLFLDSIFSTKPYALVICLILSSIAGLKLLFLKL